MNKQATFLDGVAVAFVAAISAAVLLTALPQVFGMDIAFRLVVSAIGFGYILYLLHRSHEPVGRIAVIALWTVLTTVVWLLNLPLLAYMGVQLGAIWLIRSLYFYTSVLSAFADLGLSGMSLLTAFWAVSWTGSIFLSLWCFFLLQSLFVFIPASWKAKTFKGKKSPSGENPFDLAHRAAEAAVHKLSQQ